MNAIIKYLTLLSAFTYLTATLGFCLQMRSDLVRPSISVGGTEITSTGNIELVGGSTVAANGSITISTSATAAEASLQDRILFDSTSLKICRNTSPMLEFYRANGTQSSTIDSAGGTLSILSKEASSIIIIDNPGQSQAIRIDATGHLGLNNTTIQAAVHAAGVAGDSYVVQVSSNDGTDLFTVNHEGGTGIYSRTVAQIGLITPRAVGEMFYCSNCTALRMCISTGTVVGSFASPVAATTVCN